MSLSVQHARVAYGGAIVVDDVSCLFEKGVTGILGPNGAGKTTLLRCLSTVAQPDSGSIDYQRSDGSEFADIRSLRRKLGYLPQHPGAYPNFTVQRFVRYVAALKDIPRQAIPREAERVLAAVDLADRGSSRTKSLSGGMKQRLALACALLGEPEFLLLDEPTVGLDPEQRIRFREIVSRHAADAAVVLSTHLTEEVVTLCRRVVVMDRGRVVFQGTPKELAARAEGKVWITATPTPSALASWEVEPGRVRQIGYEPPPNHEPLDAGVDDGYLIALRESAQ